MICLISFSKFSDVLLASAICNLSSICLEVNILSIYPYFTWYLASDTIEELSLNNLIIASFDW